MSIVLKNKLIELEIDRPLENYQGTRFDWTGKIISLKYKGQILSSQEIASADKTLPCGRGFYNEFGIKTPVGHDEIPIGAWFPKIGLGLLKKRAINYDFTKDYEVRPAFFKVQVNPNQLLLECRSDWCNGYAYVLKKKIQLLENGFKIHYHLENIGEKPIVTSEYSHNFLALNQYEMGSHYELQFPFTLQPTLFLETINPEQAVKIEPRQVTFKHMPSQAFFFSNLSGHELVEAGWRLINTKSGIGISETTDFQTKSIELWGCQHVISPELYINLNIKPGKIKTWSRTYTVFEL